MPFQVLGLVIRFLLSLVALGVGIYLISQWRGSSLIQVESNSPRRQIQADPDGATADQPDREKAPAAPVVEPLPGLGDIKLNSESLLPLLGLGLVLWSVSGGWFSTALFC